MLKVLIGASDQEIIEHVTMQDYTNAFLTDRVEPLLCRFKIYSLCIYWSTAS